VSLTQERDLLIAHHPVAFTSLPAGESEKRALVLVRYALILSSSYLLVFESGSTTISPIVLTLIVLVLGSNLLLSYIPETVLLKPHTRGIIICADTGWIVWGLSQQGSFGPDIFLLYFFVLFLSAIGESLILIITTAVILSAVDLVFLVPLQQQVSLWESPSLMRVPFIFSVAVFYAYFAEKVKQERRHALIEREFAEKMAKVVYTQTKVLREEAEDLRGRYDEIQRMSKVKDQFLQVAAHELRTPLHIIMSYVGMLEEGAFGPLKDKQLKGLKRIERANDHQLFMINSIIGLAELSSSLRTQRVRFRLEELCCPLIDRYRTLAEKKGVIFKEEFSQGESVGETDKERIAFLLSHLLDNAIKFTEKGEIVFRAGYERDRDQFRFEVKDTGIGFPEEMIPKLLEPFEQRDMSQTRTYGGLGIGLGLVKKYVDFLGGALHISSKEHEGSSFVVEIPAH
jgi:signal transduction histidine kinase